MRQLDATNITDTVLETLAATPDSRLKAILTTVVRHAHDCVRELNVVDPFTRQGFRFKGVAKLVKDTKAHLQIARILGPDYPFEQVVKIRVETASEAFSPVYTLTQASEAEVKRFWLERYGYGSAREAGGAHDCP